MIKAQPTVRAWAIPAGTRTMRVRRAEIAIGMAAGVLAALPRISHPAMEAVRGAAGIAIGQSALAVVGSPPYIVPMITQTKGPIAQEIEARLSAAFAPVALAVINDSASHSGHMGDDGSGESHFTVQIVSAAFTGVSRVNRQRMVNQALGDLPGQRVHALAIKASAPGE